MDSRCIIPPWRCVPEQDPDRGGRERHRQPDPNRPGRPGLPLRRGRRRPGRLRPAGDGELFDLVLLDIMLPGADGYEVLDYCRVLEVPVIFLTAKGTVED